jgi:uncharacterized membrane protein
MKKTKTFAAMSVLMAVWPFCSSIGSAQAIGALKPGRTVSTLGDASATAVMTFVVIDPPGATQSRALGMNEVGDVVGLYRDTAGAMHGFLRSPRGEFSTIDVPGATFTIAHGINNLGEIVGRFGEAGTGHVRGFALAEGEYAYFDFPGSTHIEPEDINEKGEVSGKYLDSDGRQHGFILIDETFETIDVPGAATTDAQSVCNSGTIVGDIGDAGDTKVQSFTMAEGILNILDFPGASVTAARFRSEAGAIVGIVIDDNGQHGFRRDRYGTYVTIDVPGATQTSIFAGNDQGNVAGSFTAGGYEYAFLALK